MNTRCTAVLTMSQLTSISLSSWTCPSSVSVGTRAVLSATCWTRTPRLGGLSTTGRSIGPGSSPIEITAAIGIFGFASYSAFTED